MRPHSPGRNGLARWLPALVWCGVIFAGSSVPGSSIPGGYSVYGHFGEYAVLALLIAFALRLAPTGRLVLLTVALCAVYALTDEFHQAFVPMRTPDPLDWLTDVVGATAGACVFAFVRGLRSR